MNPPADLVRDISFAFRDSHSRRVANVEQVNRVAHLALNAKPAIDFCGYWQRLKAAAQGSVTIIKADAM